MDEIDRWVALEGPPPPGVRQLLDLMVPPMSPEKEAELDARLFAAIEEDRRREERRNKLKWIAAFAAAAALFASCTGAATLAYRRGQIDTSRATPAVHVFDTSLLTPDVTPDGGAPR